MDTTQPEELLADDRSVAAVAREYLGKELPIDVRTDIYGSDDPLQRTLKEQLLHIIGVSYYLNPDTGNDNNDGSAERPWKTLAYAFEQVYEIQHGKPDPPYVHLILQDGLYTGEGQTYVTLGKHYTHQSHYDEDQVAEELAKVTVTNVTIKAENKYQPYRPWNGQVSPQNREDVGAKLDGGWGPEYLGNWEDDGVDITFYDHIGHTYWNRRPEWAPNKYPKGGGGHAAYNSILKLLNCKNVTIDGLYVQNSIGSGILLWDEKYPGTTDEGDQKAFKFCERITVRNCRFDWCHFGAIKCGWEQNGLTLEHNDVTRCSFDYWINKRAQEKTEEDGTRVPPERREATPLDGDRSMKDDERKPIMIVENGSMIPLPDKGPTPGNWTTVFHWANSGTIRDNVCAYSYGEVGSRHRSCGTVDNGNATQVRFGKVEDNWFIANSNNCYLEGLRNTTARNNVLVSYPKDYSVYTDDAGKTIDYESTHFFRRNAVNLAIANEGRNHWCKDSDSEYVECADNESGSCGAQRFYFGDFGTCHEKEFNECVIKHHCDNLRVYNNLLLWGKVVFRSRYAMGEGKARRYYPLPIKSLYFGHNTILAGAHPDSEGDNFLFQALTNYTYNLQNKPESGDEEILGILENNLWDASYPKSVELTIKEGAQGQGPDVPKLHVRNNVFPKTGTGDGLSGLTSDGNHYTDEPQLENSAPIVNGSELLTPPKINLSNTEMDTALRSLLDNLGEYVVRLKLTGKEAINMGSTGGAIGETEVPKPTEPSDPDYSDNLNSPHYGEGPRTHDFFGKNRDPNAPDIGAFEYVEE